MKIKVSVIASHEFEVDTRNYPEGWDLSDIVGYEKEVFEDQPGLIFDISGSNIRVSVEGLD